MRIRFYWFPDRSSLFPVFPVPFICSHATKIFNITAFYIDKPRVLYNTTCIQVVLQRKKNMKPKPLKDIVYKTLRNEILSGKIPGSTHITESSIAKRLNVSRTPVREALQRLTQEKLVISLPRAGYIIEEMSDDDIQDLFSTRFDIETLIVRKAVQYITADELNRLGDTIENAKECIKSGDLKKLTELDLEFHSIIYRSARSKTLYRICRNLGDLTMKYRHGLNLESNLWNEIIATHTMIYQALLAKDSDRAVEAILHHGDQARYQLLEIMKKVRSDSFFDEDV